MMINSIKLALIMLALDAIYLNLTKKHFNNLVKSIQNKDIKFKMVPAFFAYLLMTIGLYHFVIKKNGSIEDAFLLGLVIYGVFDTTNAVLFEKWDVKTILMDTFWGASMFATSTYIYYKISN